MESPPPSRRERRSEHYRAAVRAAVTMARSRFVAARATELRIGLAGVVARAIAHGRPQRVGSEHLRQRAAEEGIAGRFDGSDRPAHGTLANVLEQGQRLGLWSWPKYHRPREVRPGVFRSPARLLQVQGGMRAVIVAALAPALVAGVTGPASGFGTRSCTSSVTAALEADAASPLTPSAEDGPPGDEGYQRRPRLDADAVRRIFERE